MAANERQCEDIAACKVEKCQYKDGTSRRSVMESYRPWGSLARALYEKQQYDGYLNNFDKMQVSFKYRNALKKLLGKA